MIVDTHKAGGVIVVNRRLLVAREFGKVVFTAPGGKLDNDESSQQALIRELQEEFSIVVTEADIEPYGVFYAKTTGDEAKTIRMDAFIVNKWGGRIKPSSEIEEVKWVTTDDLKVVLLGSILVHDVIPRLKGQDLID